ncbi:MULTISPECIES: hypothetical protein [Streptococcus]|uniref:Lipoprotein n=1 Tax=Streptococcus equinus ATCC 9812 TaxID=525379 RepID=E8JQA1_STREI|nr:MULTISPECIES: hypothetical protein [Streptococcus]EFW88584.1 hypothetical protein HMPREF0819_1174 [Streptococcus equinus ATCC 9812]MCQ2963237.1 hypothetical protein [Streptococcus sp.]SUN57633.1 lipoprotein [Streptococcus equinus]SUO81220.1 lipoprotein [Streptococcus equinus]
MKKIKSLLFVLLFGTLSGCSAVSETFYDIKTETNKTYQSEVIKMDIEATMPVEIGEEINLPDEFSGTLYVMFSKKNLAKALKADFYLNDAKMKTIDENSCDDFNVRYHKKTYFSVYKMSVKNIDKFKTESAWSDDVVLVLRSE